MVNEWWSTAFYFGEEELVEEERKQSLVALERKILDLKCPNLRTDSNSSGSLFHALTILWGKNCCLVLFRVIGLLLYTGPS